MFGGLMKLMQDCEYTLKEIQKLGFIDTGVRLNPYHVYSSGCERLKKRSLIYLILEKKNNKFTIVKKYKVRL